jgi:hypothetical protein
MLRKLIIIENDKHYQCDDEESVVRLLIDSNYYELTEKEKMEKMKIRATANSINKKMEILEAKEISKNTDINDKFVLLDEKTYILSLLTINKVTLLERVDSNIYTRYLDKEKFTKNYVIVNNFAKEILKKYIDEKIK